MIILFPDFFKPKKSNWPIFNKKEEKTFKPVPLKLRLKTLWLDLIMGFKYPFLNGYTNKWMKMVVIIFQKGWGGIKNGFLIYDLNYKALFKYRKKWWLKKNL